MALTRPLSKFATIIDDESPTEQEHKDSCDINKMMLSLSRGLEVRGSRVPQYGYDDTTMDGVQFRVEKERLERDLAETARSHEFSEEEFEALPEAVRKKFDFKKKQAKKPDANDDDKTTTKKSVKGTASKEVEKSTSQPEKADPKHSTGE